MKFLKRHGSLAVLIIILVLIVTLSYAVVHTTDECEKRGGHMIIVGIKRGRCDR